ncbi:glutathione S-transferase [Ferrovibrio sp.]|uniref:glutathione S-transferase family protein n=1 Tax=Ferrovibrio sp. TaxID=1917215 RepID=UPI0025BFE4F8|nr:glutathione S-transferase [Ferrovibrio sp.]MBX3456522.1 glutathione S-transferase [Ferrovibrio sp.]
MIIVHHLNNSRSQRVLWLLEELGLPYSVKRYERRPDMLAPKELRQVHPLGKSPVIEDNGLKIAETGAIIEYLLDRYDTPDSTGAGKLRPARGTDAGRAFTYWLHYAEGSAMPLLLLKLVFMRMPANVPGLLRPLVKMIAGKGQARMTDPQLTTHMTFWAETLKATPWFAGQDFSAADIQMSFPLEAAASRVGLQPEHAVLREWLDRIHARPAYQRALETGGPYELLK